MSAYNSEAQSYQLSDGRKLAYDEYGDPQGHPAFYFHGGPGSRLEGALFHEGGLKHGLRIMAVDRPGMGQSDFLPGRTMLDFPKDVVALADSLGLDRFGVIGWSGGGPSALTTAYAIPERLTFVLSLASFPLLNFEGAPDLLNKADRFAYTMAHKMPFVFNLFFVLTGFTARNFPKQYFHEVEKAACEADRRIFNLAGIREILIKDGQESFRQGSRGPAYDAMVDYGDWGYKLEDISIPVHVWQGAADTMVPYPLGEHLAKTIPNAIFHKLPDEGHFFPVTHMDEIMEAARSAMTITMGAGRS